MGILNESVPKNSPFFGVPHPVTLIVDQRGVIQSRHFEEDYRRRPTIGNILGDPATPGKPFKNPRLSVETSSSDTKIRGGERIRLFVRITLPRKMHVYAPGVSGYIPLDWKAGEGQGAEWLPVSFPKSRTLHLKAINETVPVFENSFILTRDVVIGSSRDVEKLLGPDKTLKIESSLRVQACDDKKCYVPEEVPLVWTLAYEAHDSTRVPPELRRTAR